MTADYDNATILRVTYRFLRLSILAVVALLAVSLIFERIKSGCLQGSISGYYYTPVRSVFVGALLAISVCLISIKGVGNTEDIALNLAGMFAPVVAFVPTDGQGTCQWVRTIPDPPVDPRGVPITNGLLPDWVVANVKNNVFALLVVGVIAIVVISIMNKRHADAPGVERIKRLNISLIATEVVLAIAVVLYFRWGEVKTWSHFAAAGAMFFCFWIAVGANAFKRPNQASHYKAIFTLIFVLMPVALGAILVASHLFAPWEETIYWLEVAEILLFASFWLVQTVQRWNDEHASGAPAN
ncbi:MAG: hypothetical protein QOJ74_1837 [Ilumatobacteraceae bacterium]|nr:hypothetical protein [Ilumatobacteraceae bacterium]